MKTTFVLAFWLPAVVNLQIERFIQIKIPGPWLPQIMGDIRFALWTSPNLAKDNQSPSGKYHFKFLNFLTIYHYTLLMIGKGKGKPKANVMGKSKGKGNAVVARKVC